MCVYELRLCEWALVGGNVRVWDPGSGTRPPRQPQYVRVEGAGVWGLHRMKPDVEVLVVRLRWCSVEARVKKVCNTISVVETQGSIVFGTRVELETNTTYTAKHCTHSDNMESGCINHP